MRPRLRLRRTRKHDLVLFGRWLIPITPLWLSYQGDTSHDHCDSSPTAEVATQVHGHAVPFSVGGGLLREQSPWFNAALKDGRTELYLEHASVRTFRLFVAWLDSGKLVHPEVALCEQRLDGFNDGDKDDRQLTWLDTDFISLYVFGERHGLRKLCNDVLTAIHREHQNAQRITGEDAVRLLWAGCEPASALCRFILQERALYGLREHADVPGYFHTLPSSFLVNLLRAIAGLNKHRSKGYVIDKLPSACHWHDHAGNVEEKLECQRVLLGVSGVSLRHGPADHTLTTSSPANNHPRQGGKVTTPSVAQTTSQQSMFTCKGSIDNGNNSAYDRVPPARVDGENTLDVDTHTYDLEQAPPCYVPLSQLSLPRYSTPLG